MSEPLYFEDLQVGDRWVSQGRTVTEADIVNFAGLTGDYDPLHVDHQHAANSPFKRPIAHGLLGLSWVAGLGSHSPRAKTKAFLAVLEWEFVRPTYPGDTVHVVTEVVTAEPRGRRSGQVTWRRQLVNHEDVVVQTGLFQTLVETRKPLKRVRIDPPHAAPSSAAPLQTPTSAVPPRS